MWIETQTGMMINLGDVRYITVGKTDDCKRGRVRVKYKTADSDGDDYDFLTDLMPLGQAEAVRKTILKLIAHGVTAIASEDLLEKAELGYPEAFTTPVAADE